MLKIEIHTGNAAYEYDPSYELKRNLAEISEKLENGHTKGSVIDINGNKVGDWSLD